MSRRREDENDLSDNSDEEVTIVRQLDPPPAAGVVRLEATLHHQAVLLITAHAQPMRRFNLAERDHIVGRAVDVDISLVDDSISRQHAVLVFRREDYVLKDLNSKNGTFLNGTAVHECPLRTGDIIQIGNHTLRFLLETPQA